MLHCPIRPHLENTESKITLSRISRWRPQSVKPQAHGPSEEVALYDCTAHEARPGCHPRSTAWLGTDTTLPGNPWGSGLLRTIIQQASGYQGHVVKRKRWAQRQNLVSSPAADPFVCASPRSGLSTHRVGRMLSSFLPCLPRVLDRGP